MERDEEKERFRVALQEIEKEGAEAQCEFPNSCTGGCYGCMLANASAVAHNALREMR